MNKVILIGRLTAEPELKMTTNGNEVTSFSLAVDRPFSKDQEKQNADFLRCTAWNNTAKFICTYFKKGQQIALEGRLQTRQYTDKNGEKRYATEILVQNAEFCGTAPKKDGTGQNTAPAEGYSNASGSDFDEMADDEDLPF